MSKEFCFLFYPGEYLRDTQILSEKTQVAYDRIICEHMRNICISKTQLNFFTKRLSPDEISELMTTLKIIPGGFQIAWVAESIEKRRAYSETRRNNRKGKLDNISESYDEHMVIVKEIVTENKIELTDEEKLQKRKVKFISEVQSTNFTENIKTDFCDYWTEKNKSGKKMRFEMQETFELEKRLARWKKNNFTATQNNGNTPSNSEHKVGRLPIDKVEKFINNRTGEPT